MIGTYFLRGGSAGHSPETRYISNEYGEAAWGHDDLFAIHIPKAISLGTQFIYLQNPGGLDSIDPPNLMEADQFVQAEKTDTLGSAWVQGFADNLAMFCWRYPHIPILCYNGGFKHPRFDDSIDDYTWFKNAVEAYKVYLVQPRKYNIWIGMDASWEDKKNSREEYFRKYLANLGFRIFTEGVWAQTNRYLADLYDCITTESQYQKPWYAQAKSYNGKRIMRLLDRDIDINIRRQEVSKWVANCQRNGHYCPIPAHWQLINNWHVADLLSDGLKLK
jgi:hypothetical protein